MRVKLFTLPESILARLVSLESQAMIPVLASSGITVTEEEIKAEIYKDHNQEVLIFFRDETPAAWIRYGIEDGRLFVKSIQLNQKIGSFAALRGLLREVLAALKDISCTKIESVVQRSNTKSLSLHDRLGFEKIKEGPKVTRYSIDAEALRINLKRLFEVD